MGGFNEIVVNKEFCYCVENKTLEDFLELRNVYFFFCLFYFFLFIHSFIFRAEWFPFSQKTNAIHYLKTFN